MIRPRTWIDTHEWMRKLYRDWAALPPADLHGSVEPSVVEAASGHTFVVRLEVGPALTIPTGGHVALEIQASWDCHLGNCYRRGVRTAGNREQVRAGYGAWVDVACSNPEVRFAVEVSYGRIQDIVDAVVTEGTVRPGDEIRFILGPEDGLQVQAQKYAQVAILPVGVDLDGSGVYRRAMTQPAVKVIGAAAERFRVFAPAVVQPGESFPVRVLPVDQYSFNPAPRYRGTVELRVTRPTPVAGASSGAGGPSGAGSLSWGQVPPPQPSPAGGGSPVASTGGAFPPDLPPAGASRHQHRNLPLNGAGGVAAPPAEAGIAIQVAATIGDEQATGYYGMAGATVTAMATAPGTYTITAVDAGAGLIGRSAPVGVGFLRDRGIYFGEMHSQMWASMGTGTTEEFFLWGRDVAGLDFCAPANHYGQRFDVTDELWQALVDTCNRFNEPGRFATLVSYEWGGGKNRTGHGSGHKNVYFRGDSGEFFYWYKERTGAEDLWERLNGRDVLTIPHHTRAFAGVDWSVRNDRHQRLVEICSLWGISERGGPHSVQAALALGHRLGFVGGTDSHYGLANQGSYHVNDGNGLACVQATELTRDAIWQALYDRRCYATTGDRILLDVTLDGHPMGSDLAVDLAGYGPRKLAIRVAGTARLDRVEVLRNNEVVSTARPGADVWEGEWTDGEPLAALALQPMFEYDRPFVFYYVRVTQSNRQMAWASPIWLTQEPSPALRAASPGGRGDHPAPHGAR